MKYRKAIFFVVYFLSDKKIEYLLLKRKLHWKGWEFPKGGKENKETDKQTIIRELKEETGLSSEEIISFDKSGKYEYDDKTRVERKFLGQEYKLFAVKVNSKDVRIDENEHSDFRWFVFDKAVDKITWKNQKQCLKIVDKKLRKLYKSNLS